MKFMEFWLIIIILTFFSFQRLDYRTYVWALVPTVASTGTQKPYFS